VVTAETNWQEAQHIISDSGADATPLPRAKDRLLVVLACLTPRANLDAFVVHQAAALPAPTHRSVKVYSGNPSYSVWTTIFYSASTHKYGFGLAGEETNSSRCIRTCRAFTICNAGSYLPILVFRSQPLNLFLLLEDRHGEGTYNDAAIREVPVPTSEEIIKVMRRCRYCQSRSPFLQCAARRSRVRSSKWVEGRGSLDSMHVNTVSTQALLSALVLRSTGLSLLMDTTSREMIFEIL
jgi:hypothetical protein